MNPVYQLKIFGDNKLQRGLYRGLISGKAIELSIIKDGKVIKQANLSAEITSFQKLLSSCNKKIALLCHRLNINQQQLDYDSSSLGFYERLRYQLQSTHRIIFEVLVPKQWIIVFKQKNASKWHRIIPHSTTFHADTFIIYSQGKYTVFYEELNFTDYHGYLMAAELDIENNKLIDQKVILKTAHHLSYPNVFKENGVYYMIPECADSHCVDLYECLSFPYKWQKKKTLIEDIQGIDPTPLKTKDGWYLFISEVVNGADSNDELSIYKSSDLLTQPFTKLYDEPIISDVRKARMAGHFIQRNDEVFRVSQNCAKRYGHQINIHKVIQIENGYKEETIETLKAGPAAIGFHTFNQAGNIVVGDMEIMRFDWYSLKRIVSSNLNRLRFW